MAVKTNFTGIAISREQTPGVLPSNPVFVDLQPNDISAFGSAISTVARTPISKNRQREKGTITDVDATLEIPHDATMSLFDEVMDAFIFSKKKGFPQFKPSAVTSTGYTVASGGALAAGLLVYARNFTTPANNGLKVLSAGSTATEIKTSGLVAEATPPKTALLEVAGVRATAGDVQIDANGNLISTTLDFTTLNLVKGQAIFIGGENTANQFATAANVGVCRVSEVTAHKLTLSKRRNAFVADTGAGKQIDIYFGSFTRNVPVDDPDFLEVSYGCEALYRGLEDVLNGIGYEYGKGFVPNQITVEVPTGDKITSTVSFIGRDIDPITQTVLAGSTHQPMQKNEAFNTSADCMRVRVTDVDELGLSSYFTDITLTINNNVTAEKAVCVLGAVDTSIGNFDVDLTATAHFSHAGVLAAIRQNKTVSLDLVFRNNDGAFYLDIPAMTLGDGAKEFTTNETVKLSLTGQSFKDPVLGTSLGVTLFPFVPDL